MMFNVSLKFIIALSSVMFLLITFVFNFNITFIIYNYEDYHKNDEALCPYK
uniref:Uncharacterized protein n=1 Tax=Yersinia enterocolitica W22703 TaxID=913028 RepID=F4N2R0_YEREN|nr:unknown protein [Yersinia enterocolitica W22703]